MAKTQHFRGGGIDIRNLHSSSPRSDGGHRAGVAVFKGRTILWPQSDACSRKVINLRLGLAMLDLLAAGNRLEILRNTRNFRAMTESGVLMI